jgi:TolB-like protein
VRAFRIRMEARAVPAATARSGWKAGLAAGVLLLLAIGALRLWGVDRGRLPAPEAPLSDEELTVPGFAGAPAIAVLAFDNLSGDPEQEYFADGIAEDLITRLSSWRSVPVIARNSSFVYKGRAVDVKQVSRELGARYVVEGSVRKGGERVRISAQLIDASSGAHVWAETYDRELRDVFALQDEISQAIVFSMRPELRRAEVERAVRKRPENLDAYESQLRGQWHFWKFTREHNATARSFFARAAELDPHYVEPHGWVADTHFMDVTFEWSESRSRSIAALEGAARDCVELDAGWAGCQLSLGFAYNVTGRRDEQIAAFQRAVRLDPSLGVAHGWLGMALALAGRPEEAIDSLEQALRLSPRDPAKELFLFATAVAHFAAGRYTESVEWAQRMLRHDPRAELAYRTLAASYAQLGRLDEARSALDEALRLEPDLSLRKVRHQNPTTDPEFLARWLDGLRKAGLKEE